MLFDVRVVPVGGWDVVAVVGDLDLSSLPTLRHALDEPDGLCIAADLSGVDYLDPVALGVLLTGSLRASRSGGRFVVVCPPGPARSLLAETGVDRIVDVVESRSALGRAHL
ncbi:MAG: STAS domain-containing protein [Actinobacteria bacterium]|nr:STAS domain-containing protein [Actinomycetota bacterium]